MPFPYDKYPWLNFQELNLAYFIKHFREIFQQWDQLYHDLTEWKEATDQDLADWKSATEAGLESWKTGLTTSLEAWKSQTATDISGWETATLAALDAWKTATTAVFEQIRVEAAGSASAAAASATAADTARAAAASAQTAAEQAAAEISADLAQIQTNTADIADLKSALQNIIIRPSYTKYEGKLVRLSGLDSNANFDTYRYEIPDNVESIHVTTNFYGQAYIIFSNKDYDATFNNFPFAQYPDSGYENPTDVDVELSTHGFKYVYVPYYKASSVNIDAYYSELPVINNKVDKNGTGQVNEKNTTFFEKHESRNIADVADDTITESPLTLVAEDNHFVTAISTALTERVMPIFHEMLLEAGTYTFTVYADDDYSALGGGTFIGLYTGENKNVLYQYASCIYTSGASKTFTLSEDTIVYFRFRTQDITEANANYSAFGYIGFRMMLSKTASAIAWENPKPTWIFEYSTSSETEFANVAMFEKIGVIGDSYASGQIYLSDSPVNYYNLSWGQVLARRIGATCINLSRGGLTTKTWLESDRGLAYLQNNDPQGLYIIALGINDYTEINAGRYNLGTESDFDLSDYENTPDTFFGNMCKIIGYVMSKSPNAKIVLSTMALHNNTLRKLINNAIERCAELANIVSVRQYEDPFFNSDYYANGMVIGHPTAPTYSGMATAMERLINKCMNDNYSYFYTYTWS